ncbi:hypothetical protein [Tessaracoccus sp. Z1128]
MAFFNRTDGTYWSSGGMSGRSITGCTVTSRPVNSSASRAVVMWPAFSTRATPLRSPTASV